MATTTAWFAPTRSRAATSGLPDSATTPVLAAPGPTTIIVIAATGKIIIATTIAFGTDRAGSFASSAAIGTPSMARKNHMANGIAAQIPARPPSKREIRSDVPDVA